MPTIESTPIPGLLIIRLDVHSDGRGWFKENWQREKLLALGLPDFGPVQHNVSFNATRGVTRGIHAEPWDKLVSVMEGTAFGAWVDLREGDSFGRTHHLELDASVSVFVPRGVGNSYQTLADNVSYSYLVNQHWRADAQYVGLDIADPEVGIPWPIPLDQVTLSEKDLSNPSLAELTPMPRAKTLITGADGQLGRALAAEFPDAVAVGREQLDITDPAAVAAWPWHEYGTVLNAAAYTAVDEAETSAGRPKAWAVNATGPAHLSRAATEHRLTLVHYSTDYVFDGSRGPHAESEPVSPLGVYGQSKAAGETAVALTPKHYVLRLSWLIGDGSNFVRTMQGLALGDTDPDVVADQVGRLTFTAEAARATRHLLEAEAAFGTYHVSNTGPDQSWADIASEVFACCGADPARVSRTTGEAYGVGKHLAPRPADSRFDLTRLTASGFQSEPASVALRTYLAE